MNENETELKVQALVDGELTGREAEDLRARIETDDGLRKLHARLTAVRGLMAGAELPRTLPESGDFHWNKIAQSIEREDREAKRLARPAPGVNRLLRWVTPLAGAACLVAGAVSATNHDARPRAFCWAATMNSSCPSKISM